MAQRCVSMKLKTQLSLLDNSCLPWTGSTGRGRVHSSRTDWRDPGIWQPQTAHQVQMVDVRHPLPWMQPSHQLTLIVESRWPKKLTAWLELWHPQLTMGNSQSSWLRMITDVLPPDLRSSAAKDRQSRDALVQSLSKNRQDKDNVQMWLLWCSDATEILFGKSKERWYIFSSLAILNHSASVLSTPCPRHPEKGKISQNLTKPLSAKGD